MKELKYEYNKVFTDPNDPTWHLVKDNYDSYGIHHDCTPHTWADAHTHGCMYCGAQPPKELKGMYELCSWRNNGKL